MLEKISYVLPQKIQTSTVVEELPTLIILVIFLGVCFKAECKNTASNLTIYIGEPKLNGIARYIADKFNINDRHVDIIYIKKDLYEKHADLVLEKGWYT
jgi:hypothetical protein